MPVLTSKEYKKRKSNQDYLKKEGVEKIASDAFLQERKKVERKKEYILLHPENPKDFFLNFEDEIELKGKTYKRVCTGGIVRTREKELYSFLKSKGYELLDIKEL